MWLKVMHDYLRVLQVQIVVGTVWLDIHSGDPKAEMKVLAKLDSHFWAPGKNLLPHPSLQMITICSL